MINVLVNQLLSKLGGTSMDKLVRKFCHVTQKTNIPWTPLDCFVTRTCLISCETVLSWRFISRRNENPRWHHLGFRSCKPCVKYFQLDFLIIRAFEVLIVNHFKVIAALRTVLRWASKNSIAREPWMWYHHAGEKTFRGIERGGFTWHVQDRFQSNCCRIRFFALWLLLGPAAWWLFFLFVCLVSLFVVCLVNSTCNFHCSGSASCNLVATTT